MDVLLSVGGYVAGSYLLIGLVHAALFTRWHVRLRATWPEQLRQATEAGVPALFIETLLQWPVWVYAWLRVQRRARTRRNNQSGLGTVR